jgi:hypothetical protein
MTVIMTTSSLYPQLSKQLCPTYYIKHSDLKDMKRLKLSLCADERDMNVFFVKNPKGNVLATQTGTLINNYTF